MRYISSYQNKLRTRFPAEIIDTEVTDGHHQRPLPRHISAPETSSCKNRQHFTKMNVEPRVCSINTFKPIQPNVALDLLKYQLGDRAAKQKHSENIRANIKRRLEVAMIQENSQLVDILQEEYRQLEANR